MRLGGAIVAGFGLGAAYVEECQRLGAQFVQQQARGDIGVVGLLLHQRACGDEQRRGHVACRNAVIHVVQCLLDDAPAIDVRQSLTGLRDESADTADIQWPTAAIGHDDADVRVLFGGHGVRFSGSGPFFAVQHVAACYLVLPRTHEREFHLVLDVLDVKRAPRGQTAPEGIAHLIGQRTHQLTYSWRGGRGTAFDGEEGLGDGNVYLVLRVRHDGAVALYDFQLTGRGGGQARCECGCGIDDRWLLGGVRGLSVHRVCSP